jgi:hypothetical protein
MRVIKVNSPRKSKRKKEKKKADKGNQPLGGIELLSLPSFAFNLLKRRADNAAF